MPIGRGSSPLLPRAPRGMLRQQTTSCCISLWTLVGESYSCTWARGQVVPSEWHQGDKRAGTACAILQQTWQSFSTRCAMKHFEHLMAKISILDNHLSSHHTWWQCLLEIPIWEVAEKEAQADDTSSLLIPLFIHVLRHLSAPDCVSFNVCIWPHIALPLCLLPFCHNSTTQLLLTAIGPDPNQFLSCDCLIYHQYFLRTVPWT